jgi:hypothetical protein
MVRVLVEVDALDLVAVLGFARCHIDQLYYAYY